MLGTAVPAPATPWRHTPLAAPRAAEAHAPPAERRCQYCAAGLVPDARKCRGCGEWVVPTSAGPAAALLRLLGWCWGALSVAGAAALWYGGTAARRWVVARAVDPIVAPLVLDFVVYALVGLVLLQGLTVGVGLGVVANLAPRRPRWWS